MFIPLHDHNALDHIVRPYVNWSIIAVTVLVYAVFQSGLVFDAMWATVRSYGMIPSVITDRVQLPPGIQHLPEETTLFTYAFLHGSWWHLIGNMLFVYVFGDNIEDAVGHFKYLLFYLLAAAGGAAMHVLIQPGSNLPLVGASGAAAGIVAAYLLLHPHVKVWVLAFGRIPLRLPALWVLGAWIAWQIVQIILMADVEVAWWAHVGGILSGAVLIFILRRPGVKLFT